MFKYLRVLLCIAFGLTACGVDDDATVSFDSKLLLNKTWVIRGLTVKAANGPEEDFYNKRMEECQQDDELNFYADGLYKKNPGALECDVSVYETGNWYFTKNRLVLVDQDHSLLELTDQKLRLAYTFDNNGQPTTVHTTYTAK